MRNDETTFAEVACLETENDFHDIHPTKITNKSQSDSFRLSLFLGGVKTTQSAETINSWVNLCELVATPNIGKKDGDYFTRGFSFGNREDENLKKPILIIIDGDQLNDNAATCCKPETVNEVLSLRNITHTIYTSFSNDPDNGIYKWRAVIPSFNLTSDNLRQAVDEIINVLNEAGLNVKSVKENYTLSQPWYTPRCQKSSVQYFYSAVFDGDDYEVGSFPVFDQEFFDKTVQHTGSYDAEAITAAFKSGTLHQGILSTAGRYVREGKLNDQEIYDKLADQVKMCPVKDKVKRALSFEIMKAIEYCRKKSTPTPAPFDKNLLAADSVPPIFLPDYPKELLALTNDLGRLQQFIFNRMAYPSLATAGFTALAVVAAFAQTEITIDSREGLGLNEFFMVLAATGFGKEDLRRPFTQLDEITGVEVFDPSNNIARGFSTKFQHAAPASAQGIHQTIEANRSVFFLSDEFAEWLKGSHTAGSHKQQALGYLMQSYTRALGSLHPGHAVTKEYTVVKNPRIGVLATSTAEAMLGTMTREQADSGAYNRWIIFAGDPVLPEKRYRGLIFDPEQRVIDFVKWVKCLPPTKITFSQDAFQTYVDLDSTLAEPAKRVDGLLGGRLGEQSIKIAALIALSDRRIEIVPEDLETAFAIRMGLYHRAAALARSEGSLEGLHHTGEALAQVTKLFEGREGLYRSQLPSLSRKYKKLSVVEQKGVLEALLSEGIAAEDQTRKTYLVSLRQG